MGAWSPQPFGNDTAADWAYGLTESADLAYVEAALDKVLESGADYLEAPDAEEAVAAIEVIAKLLGKGTQSDAYTESVDAWVASSQHQPGTELLRKAGRAIDRILSGNSELLDLWQESDEAPAWQESLSVLRAAVSG
jgi:hypothetical protein